MASRTLPMFPLGRALLPAEALPLRIFEPRYLEMMEVVRDGDGEFGVVLISRGWETGGGDDRYGVGTIAKVAQDVALAEDQRAVVAVGATRFAVEEWLPDDPYPLARITGRSDDRAPVGEEARIRELGVRVRRLYALASELGADTAAQDLALPGDLELAVWRLGSLIPLSEYDRQRLLELDDPSARLDEIDTLLADVIDELTMRLAQG